MANFNSPQNRGCSLLALSAVLFLLYECPIPAVAQQQVQGFAVERFYPSAPGGGWFVMDELNMSGGLGGAISLTSGYSRNSLEIANPDGARRLALVSNQAFLDVGVAATYHRYRVYLNLPMPLLLSGQSGLVGPYQLRAPDVNLGTNPDTISDSRIGFDVRLLGRENSSFRLGAGAQVIIPSGIRADYVTDGRYRGMFRVLAAGDVGRFSYAAQLGMHVRPVEGSLPPGVPGGNEVLFGGGAGRRFAVRSGWTLVVGPEFFGETVVRSGATGQTGVEGLLTTRFEESGAGRRLRVKVGVGHGLVQKFSAPEWRVLVSVEIFGQGR